LSNVVISLCEEVGLIVENNRLITRIHIEEGCGNNRRVDTKVDRLDIILHLNKVGNLKEQFAVHLTIQF
jgi:hypothetical protein